MANVIPFIKNASTGQVNVVSSSDILVDSSSNVLIPPMDRLISTTSSISLTATGTTNLLTVPTGKTFVFTKAVVRVTSFAGSLSTAPVAGLGVAAGEDDVAYPQTLDGLTTSTSSFTISASNSQSVTVAAASIVKIGVDTAATGTGLTLTVAVDLFGYYSGETTSQGGGLSVPGRYSGCIYRNSNQSILNATDTAINYNSEIYDPSSMHSTITNTDRVTIPFTGLYIFTAGVVGNTIGSSYWRLTLDHTNSGGVSQNLKNVNSFVSSAQTELEVTAIFNCTATDYITSYVYQSSGGSADILGSSTPNIQLSWSLLPGQ